MKKSVLLCMVLILMLVNIIPAFADAAAFDLEYTDYYVYVATPDGGLNMRYGPGTEYDKVMEGRIPDGVQLYISMVSDNWGYTSYNGNEGWVALKQTTTTPPSAPVPPPVSPQAPVEPPVVEEEPAQVTDEPAIINEEPQNTQQPPVPVPPPAKPLDVGIMNRSIISQIAIVAVIVILVIILAVFIVIIINSKSRK